MEGYLSLEFHCKCGVKAEAFSGMAQSQHGELVVMWFCTEGCGKQCYAIVAGITPTLLPEPLWTEDDVVFLKSCNAYLKCEGEN